MASEFRSKVSGIGSYLPEKVLTNFDLEKLVETNNQWIVERTGIERRHMASPEEATSDLAYKATLKALDMANLKAEDLDMIIVATVSPDQIMPSTACVLQSKLGCRNIFSFDLSAACSGFVYALSVADQFIRTGVYKNVLVVGAEVLHRFVNYKDRETCILFGDGAGAWILSRTSNQDENIIFSSHLHADGNLGDLFVLPAGGSKIPFSEAVLKAESQYVKMKGREIFKNAVRTLTDCCHEALAANNVNPNQVDWLVPHQANLRILESVADHFEFPKEKVIVSLNETGNTSAASIPLAFDLAYQEGKIKRGQLILLAAFGAGLTSGSILLRF
ncbi:MAG: ketoacyl-ACP synthase III [Bdellovibrionaceae bacterium]|nr:ketoacyl-ACP synthase III [Pseudobdellovibrionaceae bacterium]NUM58198.1 ketoacyl-ACP synthase III [Pseudobdellovibrionaceae bacterium]